MASLPWKSNIGGPSDEELVTCFPASILQASNRNESTAVAQLIHAPARPAPTHAEKEDFCRVIEESYADLLAYARGRLGESAIPATQQGRGKVRTRFAAEERVHEAVADLLENGSYASCATDEERLRFLTRTVTFRLKREFRERKVRRQKRQLPLQAATDDPSDENAAARTHYYEARDVFRFQEDYAADNLLEDPYIPSNVPQTSRPTWVKARLESRLVAKIDLQQALDAECIPLADQLMLAHSILGLTWAETTVWHKASDDHFVRLVARRLHERVQGQRERLAERLIDYRQEGNAGRRLPEEERLRLHRLLFRRSVDRRRRWFAYDARSRWYEGTAGRRVEPDAVFPRPSTFSIRSLNPG